LFVFSGQLLSRKQYKRIVSIFVIDNGYIDNSAKMKEQKEHKGQVDEKMPEMEFTIDESLNKYKDPKYAPPKLKEVEKKLSKGIIIHR
jgi:hypothetical protein